MNKKIILTGLILTISFAAHTQSWWGNGEKIKGNGNVVTKTRTTQNYDGVGIGGNFDVNLVQGAEGKITIEAEENIIPYIVTEVKGNTLQIKYKKNTNVRNTKRITITVPYADIEKVSLGGSGNITNKGTIKSDNFKVSLGGSGNITLTVDANDVKSSIGGSGNIKLSGNSNEFKCSIAGSGSIKAYDLKTDILTATIAGSGSIKSTVKTKIKAKVVGSGNIYYKGNPTHIDSKSVGSGDVIDKN